MEVIVAKKPAPSKATLKAYENSPADRKQHAAGVKEGSAKDRRQDIAGARKGRK
jgi:hypothetical protein